MSALAELMATIAAPPRLAVEYRVSADKDYLSDNPQRRCPDLSKLRTRTGWRPEVRLADAPARTLASYRDAGPAEAPRSARGRRRGRPRETWSGAGAASTEPR